MDGTVFARYTGLSSVATKSAESVGADRVINRGPGARATHDGCIVVVSVLREDRAGSCIEPRPWRPTKTPPRPRHRGEKGRGAEARRQPHEGGHDPKADREQQPPPARPSTKKSQTNRRPRRRPPRRTRIAPPKRTPGGAPTSNRTARATTTSPPNKSATNQPPHHHRPHRCNRSTSCARRRDPLTLKTPREQRRHIKIHPYTQDHTERTTIRSQHLKWE